MGRNGMGWGAVCLLGLALPAGAQGLPGGPVVSSRGKALATQAQTSSPRKAKGPRLIGMVRYEVGTGFSSLDGEPRSRTTKYGHVYASPGDEGTEIEVVPWGNEPGDGAVYSHRQHGAIKPATSWVGPSVPEDTRGPLPMELFTPVPKHSGRVGESAAFRRLLRSPDLVPFGKGVKLYGDAAFRRDIRRVLERLQQTPTGKAILDGLAKSGKTTVIGRSDGSFGSAVWAASGGDEGFRRADGKPGAGSHGIVGAARFADGWLDDDAHMIYAVDILGHELIHALHRSRGESYRRDDVAREGEHKFVPLEELRTVGLGQFADEPISENALRRDLNALYPKLYFPPRERYGHRSDEDIFAELKRVEPKRKQAASSPKRSGAARAIDQRF